MLLGSILLFLLSSNSVQYGDAIVLCPKQRCAQDIYWSLGISPLAPTTLLSRRLKVQPVRPRVWASPLPPPPSGCSTARTLLW